MQILLGLFFQNESSDLIFENEIPIANCKQDVLDGTKMKMLISRTEHGRLIF